MKFQIVLSLLCYSFIISECDESTTDDYLRNENDTNVYLNSLQIIRKYGYPAEAHIVQTADGYLLEMHRIPHGKNSRGTGSGIRRKPPIFFQHGLLSSSIDFILSGPENGLPFILADLGFDVWFGNVRGNTYSRAHVSLSPDDEKFWNFTWHQSAIYDLPAEIDYICNYTKHEKIIYIGYSMGTTLFLVLTSTLPEYNDKIIVSQLMAAVAYVKNIKSPLLRLIAPLGEQIKFVAELIAKGEFLTESTLWELLVKFFCNMSHGCQDLCTDAIFLIVGSDSKEFDKPSKNHVILAVSFIEMVERHFHEFEDHRKLDVGSTVKRMIDVLATHYPAGYSAMGVNHYSQLVMSGKFRQYDFGIEGNILEYGTPTPPDYPVENIKTPIYIYEGRNDYLSTLPDVKKLARRLTSIKNFRTMEYAKFSHLDFLLSLDVKRQLYEPMVKDLMWFLKKREKKIA